MGKCVANSKPAVKLWSHGRAQRHLKQCQVQTCNKCWWVAKGRKWAVFFPWLRFGECLERRRPGHGFGCSACAQFQHLRRNGSVFAVAQRPIATPCRTFRESEVERLTLVQLTSTASLFKPGQRLSTSSGTRQARSTSRQCLFCRVSSLRTISPWRRLFKNAKQLWQLCAKDSQAAMEALAVTEQFFCAGACRKVC